MYICFTFNLIMIIAFVYEISVDYAVVLDKDEPVKRRKKYTVKLIVAMVVMFVGLMILYSMFGLTSENLGDYLIYGKV